MMKKKILVVEDDSALSNTLKLTLQNFYDVCLARNGREGVEMAATESPDVILMDIIMPVMDGWEALSILKENRRTAGIPVIFMSCKVQFDEILRGFRMGADHYITKPFTSRELLDGIQLVLEDDSPIQTSTLHQLSA